MNTSSERLEALLGIEFAVMLLGGGHNPAAFHEIDGRRIAHDERLEVRDIDRLASGNDQLGVDARDRLSTGPVERLDRPDRDRLELRGRLRARLPGQRRPAQPAHRPGARRTHLAPGRPARDGDRATSRPPRPRPVRDPRPSRRSRPLLPALPHRSVDRPRAGGAVGGAVPRLERAGRRRVLSTERRRGATSSGSRGTSDPRSGRGSRQRTRRRNEHFAAAAAGGNAMAQAFHHSILPLASAADRRTEIRWGLREFEIRFGRRPAGLWLPETAVDLPTLRIAAEEGVRYTILAPWQAAEPGIDTRRPYRVEVGAGRVDRRGPLRRRPVDVGLVRAGGDL